MQCIDPEKEDFISKEELRLGCVNFYANNYYEIMDEIDERFEPGFAESHPEMVAAILNSFHYAVRSRENVKNEQEISNNSTHNSLAERK